MDHLSRRSALQLLGSTVLAAIVPIALRDDTAAKRRKKTRRDKRGHRKQHCSRPNSVPVSGYDVVNIFPHDPHAFTQGLIYHDGALYEGTGLFGASTLRRVDLATGEVEQSSSLADDSFGEGIAFFGERLYQLTWLEHVAFVYDLETFALLDTFSYPTEGWGLTSDGSRLIMSDGSNRLSFRDPDSFAETGHLAVRDGGQPVRNLNELEMVKGEIWANIWLSDRIARISPATGVVLGWIDLAGLLPEDDQGGPDDVLNGIAYDATTDRLFVTGKRWPTLFEIEIRERR